MADRSITVRIKAEISQYKSGMQEAARSTTALGEAATMSGKQAKSSFTGMEANAKAVRASLIEAGKAAQEAAKGLGMSYNASGQLEDEFGNLVTQAHAAEVGLEAASDATREFAAVQQHAAAETAAATEASMTGMQRFQRVAMDQRESMEAVGKTATVMGGALVAAVGISVSKYASYDKAMSGVQAATHETAENMDLLREAAVEAGAETAYSAEEAAGAIEELAKAGVTTADILGGGLNGALALAAAGELEVATAAELAASSMVQFGLKGKDIPHIADLLAAGAGKAQGSVEDMGQALNQAGLVANQVGLTIEETTGGLAAFASAGLVGSDAGTSFKSMLQRLTPQSAEASRLMDELGLSAYDSQGEFIGLSEYAGELQGALKDMTSEQRNATLGTLFGSDAVRAASVLYSEGAVGVQEWEEAVNEAGFAAETAALLQDNLAGDLEKLGGAFDTVFLKSGSGANDALRGLVQTTEDFVDKVGQIPAPILSATAGIAGITGGALLAGGAFLTLAPRAFETVGHFRALAVSAPAATAKMGALAKGAGIAAVALVGLQVASKLAGTGMDDLGSSEEFKTAILSLSKDSVAGAKAMESFATATGSSLTEIDGLGHALETTDLNGFLKGMDFVGSVFGAFDTEVGLAEAALQNLDGSLEGLATGGNLEAAAEGFRYAAAEGGKVGQSVEKVSESFPGYLEALRNLANETVGGVTEQELLNWAMGETPPAMLAAAAASEETATALGMVGSEAATAVIPLEDIVEALFALGLISMNSRDSTAAFQQSLRDMNQATIDAGNGALGLGAVLNGTATDFDLTTEAGAAANEAFQNIAAAGMTDVEAKAREGLGQPELQTNLRTTYDSLIHAANGMGIEGAAAEALARDVLGVPDNVDIDTWMSDSALKMSDATKASIEAIPSYKRIDVDYVNTTTNRVINAGSEGHIAETGGRGGITRALGGAVFGAGTSTSDSIPAWLSTGEHVFDAEDVRKMGGQSAVYAFRAQLDAGVPAYPGGRVGREYSAPASVGSSMADAASVTNNTITIPYTGPDIHALVTAVARRLN